MLQFSIKTYKKGTTYTNPHFFILNKGMNSGNEIHQHKKNNNKSLIKPSKEPFTNSFVILFPHTEDYDTIYLTAYALWKTKFWHQFIYGSVIPFIRLQDVRKEFASKVNQEIKDHKEHLKNVETLKMLEQSEKRFQENINRINDLRRVILYRYCNK